jgi:hypothetical protein
MIRIVLVFCILAMVSCILCSCKPTSKFTTTVGEHNIEIIQMTPSLHTDRSHVTIEGGVLTYEYIDLKVKLENEVLTVNGKRYIVPRKDDSIKIIDDRVEIKVEINGQPTKPAE